MKIILEKNLQGKPEATFRVRCKGTRSKQLACPTARCLTEPKPPGSLLNSSKARRFACSQLACRTAPSRTAPEPDGPLPNPTARSRTARRPSARSQAAPEQLPSPKSAGPFMWPCSTHPKPSQNVPCSGRGRNRALVRASRRWPCRLWPVGPARWVRRRQVEGAPQKSEAQPVREFLWGCVRPVLNPPAPRSEACRHRSKRSAAGGLREEPSPGGPEIRNNWGAAWCFKAMGALL